MRSLSDQVFEALRSAAGPPRRVPRAGCRGGPAGAGISLLLAVSGGCDSMVLLHVLHEVCKEQGWRLLVAHFNHQLRGRHSDGDEALVVRVCSKLGIRCVVGRGYVTSHAKRSGMSIEMAARELRHRFLSRVARRHRCFCIVTAHHADDQAELVLLRLLRGSSREGLSGMSLASPSPYDSGVLMVRPLLEVSGKTLRDRARRRGIQFREDASNRGLDHLRNRIRRELLPLLRRAYQPAVDRVLTRTSEILRAEDQWMSAVAQDWLKRRRPGFDRLPLALQRRVVRAQARCLGVEVDFEAVERLVRSPGILVNVAGNRFLKRDADGTVVRERARVSPFGRGERAVLLSDRPHEVVFGHVAVRLRVRLRRGAMRLVREPGYECFDADAVGRRVLLRHWRAGDRFQPIGMKTAIKLQDLFTNAKVSAAERRARVVAEAESGEVFWVEGLRIGERFKLMPGTRRELEWAWRKA